MKASETMSIRRMFFLSNAVIRIVMLVVLSASQAYAQEWCQVRWVDDGDTIVLDDGRRVRYIGINAPEIAHENKTAEPFGRQAASFNRQLVSHRFVRLEMDKEIHDAYGRVLAYVFLPDGRCVNQLMIEKGYACCLPKPPNLKYAKKLLDAQNRAMMMEKGIWQTWKPLKFGVIGNKRSRRFHRSTCPFGKKIHKKSRVEFSNPWNAFQSGFAPCKRCIQPPHF